MKELLCRLWSQVLGPIPAGRLEGLKGVRCVAIYNRT